MSLDVELQFWLVDIGDCFGTVAHGEVGGLVKIVVVKLW